MNSYNPKEIEPKWQKEWENDDFSKAEDFSDKEKAYYLIEFPYPSGAGLHVGHVRSYTALDVMARKARMEGKNVLYPVGWDAFGLPTENYAIKNKIHPSQATEENIATFKRQLKSLGISFDWSREVDTTSSDYYKWTQWIFLQLYKKDLAYKEKTTINWCPSCKIGLANEEVIDSKCERCGTQTEKKEKDQWMLKITEYADRLLKDLEDLDYSDRIKAQQVNWIGKSVGAEIDFDVDDTDLSIRVFTTRPDTIFGATFMVISPEHPVIENLAAKIENFAEVSDYIHEAKHKSDMERAQLNKDKSGVELKGVLAVNPVNNERMPVFVADYVLMSYGTGAIMSVPAHDARDYEFAKKYELPIKPVVSPVRIDKINPPREGKKYKKRKTIHAIVKNSETGKYLCLKWNNHPWTTFVVGGVEENENEVEAARREVFEETGYKNLKFIKKTLCPVWAEYFAAHKDENRQAITNAVLFELENEERDDVEKDEEDKHGVVWHDIDNLPGDFTCAEFDIWSKYISDSKEVYTENGRNINSDFLDGLDTEEAKKKIIEWLKENKKGEASIKYKLRDWVFSRQHYWGEPIPMIHCEKCGWVPVPEKDLPVKLPDVENYEPRDDGESPLASIESFVNVDCPECGGSAKRETDTMPNWAGSSWYFLRYIDPDNNEALADKEKLKYWMPIDLYNGGMEHTTLHLLYSRFWNKFLFDIGVSPVSEPYKRRRSHGIVLAEDGQKMSKSRGNVVNPDDVVEKFGADILRIYEMFMGPFSDAIPWSTDGMKGVYRFLERVWSLQEKINEEADSLPIIHKTIKKVSEDIEEMKFNTAVSQLMICVNELMKEESISKNDFEKLLIILSPFAPHLACEVWESIGNKDLLRQSWLEFDESLVVEDEVNIAVQINGKLRATIIVSTGMSEEDIKKTALENSNIVKHIEDKEIKKTIYVPDRLINFVV